MVNAVTGNRQSPLPGVWFTAWFYTLTFSLVSTALTLPVTHVFPVSITKPSHSHNTPEVFLTTVCFSAAEWLHFDYEVLQIDLLQNEVEVSFYMSRSRDLVKSHISLTSLPHSVLLALSLLYSPSLPETVRLHHCIVL